MDSKKLVLETLADEFSVCKVADYSLTDFRSPFCFAGSTDGENSLVCPTSRVPANTTAREDGWRAFRVRGTLDFSLIGILAGISAVLARANIGIFAVSTYDTDYIFTRSADFPSAIAALTAAGYSTVA